MAYRKCKECGKKSTVEAGIIAGLYFFCCNEHRVKWGLDNAKHLASKAKETREKSKRKEIKEAREKLKTAGDYIKEAQTEFNRYIRVRDQGKPCISCDHPDDGSRQRHASHYRPAGKNTDLRFNTLNVHASCSICNNHKSGNLTEYRPRLIEKIGLETVETLETNNKLRRFTIEYLVRLKKVFRKKARLYEKLFR